MVKRSLWPHPGQTTEKDDVAAEGWLIDEDRGKLPPFYLTV